MEKDRDSSKIGDRGRSDCSEYGERDFIRYIRGEMTDQETGSFEGHVEECDCCARTLYQCHVERERREDEAFVGRTLDLLDKLSRKGYLSLKMSFAHKKNSECRKLKDKMKLKSNLL